MISMMPTQMAMVINAPSSPWREDKRRVIFGQWEGTWSNALSDFERYCSVGDAENVHKALAAAKASNTLPLLLEKCVTSMRLSPILFTIAIVGQWTAHAAC